MIAFVEIGCAQKVLTDISSRDDVVVNFQHVAKLGETKKYLVDQKSIPNAPPIPNTYAPLSNTSYYITTETIDVGNPTLSFKIPIEDPDRFKNARILRLVVDDLNPYGNTWSDCTVSLDAFRDNSDPQWLKDNPTFDELYTQEMEGLLPDYSKKRIHCKIDGGWVSKEYFAIASRTGSPRREPLTEIKMSLVGSEKSPQNGETLYKLTITNAGKNNAGEINLVSSFDIDTRLVSIAPSQGKCQKSKVGDGQACYLGPLAAGMTATIEVRGSPSGVSGRVEPGKPNENWMIYGVVKENSNDSDWPVNSFRYQPLRVKAN